MMYQHQQKQGVKMSTRDHIGNVQKRQSRWLLIGLVGAIGALVLSGCSTFYNSGRGMMGSSSQYYSSKLSCTPPTNLPGRTVIVSVGDMGMTQMMGGDAPLGGFMRLRTNPAIFPAGKVSVIVTNYGWRTHELVILPLAVGQSSGDRIPGSDGKVDETGSLGEASTSCGAGAGEGVQAGSITWTTLTLAPGRYEFVCNLKNHYANGMHQEVLVTA
jgi:uncharacterized cupredoxin-like copper-binding protein